MNVKTAILLFMILILSSSCSKKTVTDIDGNVYKTVKIGKQVWMTKNLRVTHFRNGDSIPHVTDSTEWLALDSGAFCYYNNDESNADMYGALYNWYAVNDPRGLAPEGWRVPTNDDWKELELYLGVKPDRINSLGLRGFNQGEKLKSQTGWHENGNGTDDVGFNALPGGLRHYQDRNFTDMHKFAYFWTSSEVGNKRAWYRILFHNHKGICQYFIEKENGFSVRCIKEK